MINLYKYTFLALSIVYITASCTKTKEVPFNYRGSEPRIVFDKETDTITNEIGATTSMPINFVANGIASIVVKKQIDNGVDSTIFNTNATNLPSDIFYTYNLNYINPKTDTLDKHIKYNFTLTDKAGVTTTKKFTITSLGINAIMYNLNGGDTIKWKVTNADGNTFVNRRNTSLTFSNKKSSYYNNTLVFDLKWLDKGADIATQFYTFYYNNKRIVVFLYSDMNNNLSIFWLCSIEQLSSTEIKLTQLNSAEPYMPSTPTSYMILTKQ